MTNLSIMPSMAAAVEEAFSDARLRLCEALQTVCAGFQPLQYERVRLH